MRSALIYALTVRIGAFVSPWAEIASQHGTAGWTAADLGSEDDPEHELILALAQLNLDVLERTLLAVSDPTSPKYGQHLSFAEVGALVRNEVGVAAVGAWLEAAGVGQCRSSPHGEYMRCRARVSVWEPALNARFKRLTRASSTVLRAPSISVPTEVRPHLVAVWLGSELPLESSFTVRTPASRRPKARGTPGYCESHPCCTPAVLRRVYNLSDAAVDGGGRGSQSVFETGGQYMSPKDLAAFQKAHRIPAHPIDHDVGGHVDDDTCAFLPYECGEASLDVQYMTATAQAVPTTFWATDKQTTFAAWIAAVAAMGDDAPLVHSVSYGQLESETDKGSQTAFNAEAVKLGARGISVLVSSGDDGVAGPAARASVGLCGYAPQWPATSPWVTTVGATQGPELGAGVPEVACSSSNNNTFITSGGGFSAAFATPSYQAAAVGAFLKRDRHALGSGYNAKGRGYPDVALVGHLYPIVVGGDEEVKDGTSASTPVMAAIVALANSRRLAQGKAPVGFANPALYEWGASGWGAAAAALFHDVTSGQNNCCAGGWSGDTAICCPSNGFYATPGWDAVTGLGSVNAGNLIEAWAAL